MCRVGWPWWTPSKTERKGNEMNNDENWENEIDLDDLPATVNGVTDALKVIIDVSRKMLGICRRAKKDIKRHGGRFWSKLDEWNAMRRAV